MIPTNAVGLDRGKLGEYAEPASATLEHQDWFEGWQEYRTSSDENDTLLEYARLFYYGE
jgi:hypothetical protein